MNEKNRNLLVRAVSALSLLPVVLWLLWQGGFATAALAGFAAGVVASEIYGLAGLPLRHPAALLGIALSALLPFLSPSITTTYPWVLAIIAGAPLLSLLLLTLLPPGGDLQRAAPLAAFAALPAAYAGLSMAAVSGMRTMPGGQGWILVVLAVTWGNDTGAYFAGRLFGRHKLYPTVSPSKTWEGFVGGLVFSVLGCFILRALGLAALDVKDCLIVGGVAGILGPLGDLSESMLKRAFGAKDSGRILPGHGGLYDRVDALLFTAPWVFAYAWVLSGPPMGP